MKGNGYEKKRAWLVYYFKLKKEKLSKEVHFLARKRRGFED